jgi:hypothetical protein
LFHYELNWLLTSLPNKKKADWIKDTICENSVSPPSTLCDFTNNPTAAPTEFKCPNGQSKLSLELQADRYYTETSFSLKNACTGSTILSKKPFTEIFESVTLLECIDSSLYYNFTIYDQYGDGMCCTYGNGGYKLYIDDVLQVEGGKFAKEESFVFGNEAQCLVTESPTSSPSHSPSKFLSNHPSSSPSMQSSYKPSPTPNTCVDSSITFITATATQLSCQWASEKPSKRCKRKAISATCPLLCNSCDVCADGPLRFIVKLAGKDRLKKCNTLLSRVNAKTREYRCGMPGVAEACRKSCGLCG